MKKFALLSIAFTLVCLSNFAYAQEIKVVQVNCLTDHDLKEIMHGQHPELAIEFAEHTCLPTSFNLKGDLASLIENEEKWRTIEIKQTFYVRCVGEELILSSNLIDWKPFMEFITGKVTATLSIQDGQPSIVVDAETNCRS